MGESPFERLTEYIGRTEATDEAVARFADARSHVASPPAGLAELVRRVDAQFDRLGALRDDVRESPVVSLSAVTFAYRTLIADLVSLREAVGQAGGVPADLAQRIGAAAALSRATEFAAQQQVDVMRGLSTGGPPTPANHQAIQANRAGAREAMASFAQLAPVAWQDWLDHALTGPDVLAAQRLEDAVARTQEATDPVDLGPWVPVTSTRIGLLHQVEQRVDESVRTDVDSLYASKVRWLVAEAAVIVIALMAAVLLAIRQSREMIRRLRRLSDAARAAAFVSLPRTVAALRAVGSRTVDVEELASQAEPPLADDVADEIGDVGNAFLAVHQEALRTAADLANMRVGLSQIFVHLARRNQRLVGALIRELDTAERDEADPDRLATLFRLDQLATRMGRYTDNLLVVGGQTTRQTPSGDVALATVLQGAQSKIENYRQIRLAGVDARLRLRADVVHDLMNLLAEIMDNATQFSPPNAVAAVEAGVAGGHVLIHVADQGVGIPPVRLDQLNRTLAEPPTVDLSAIRSMGLTVVAQIAARYGIRVSLLPGPAVGIVATIALPADVWRWDAPPSVDTHVHSRPTGSAPVPRQRQPYAIQPGPPHRSSGHPNPVPVARAEVEPPLYRDVAREFAGYFVSVGPPTHAAAGWRGSADAGWAAAAAAARPTVSRRTSAGLPQRDPSAHLVPGSVPDAAHPGAVDYRDPAQVAAAVSAFAHGNAYSRSLHARPSP